MTEVISKKPDFTMSVDTRLLYDRLVKLQVGEHITYKELSALVARDVQGKARGALNSARYRAERDQRVVTVPIRGVGLQRLDGIGIVGRGQQRIERVRRGARRARKGLEPVDYLDLSPYDKIRHNALMSVAGAVESMTLRRGVKRIEETVEKAGRILPLAETIRHFSGQQ